MVSKIMVRGFLAGALVATALTAHADVFNMGGTISGGTWTGLASLSFVTVGDPGNVADPATGGTLGSVGYTYQMGTYDVTLAQYTQFLNAVAATDTYGLYNSAMGTGFATLGIAQSGSSGSYSYSVTGSAPNMNNMPVFATTWGDAARFTNWLDNGQPTGVEGLTTTESGAYYLNGATTLRALDAVLSPSHSGAGVPQYFLPSENEWYKAAYYDPGSGTYWAYPTQSNTAPGNALPDTGNNANYLNSGYTDPANYLTPVGSFVLSPGPYGTYDMGGDLFQWNEAIIGSLRRGVRGGAWDADPSFLASSGRASAYPTLGSDDNGFRIASNIAVPEPDSLALLLAGAVAFGIWRQYRKAGWHRTAATRTAQSQGDAPATLSFP
jgi:formylglycine-generating enzyme